MVFGAKTEADVSRSVFITIKNCRGVKEESRKGLRIGIFTIADLAGYPDTDLGLQPCWARYLDSHGTGEQIHIRIIPNSSSNK
ncbi:hypothetical protein TNCV_4140271 [Trichonephila clavipes]|nr:hypothetical protein TNCV_4140271 [Trichonephila clavipes]